MQPIRLAVIGKDVSKSQSPQMHQFIAQRLGKEITYSRQSIPQNFDEEIENILQNYHGFNVTIPYKLSVMEHLKEICGDAKTFGAVNTVLANRRQGYNTDGLGFMLMLNRAGVEVNDKKVLIIGAGGAGRSCAKKLKDAGASVWIYNRTYEKAQQVATEFSLIALKELSPVPYDIIINASGIGMHDTVGQSPVEKELIEQCQVAVDLIYQPPLSQFLLLAQACGKVVINGLAMLFYQAYYADCLFLDCKPNEEEAQQLFEDYKKEYNL